MTDTPAPTTWRRYLPWFNLALTAVLVVAGLWYLSTRVSLAAIVEALGAARFGYVTAAVAAMVASIALKGWRWQAMFRAQPPAVDYAPAFWGTALGMYVNLVVPFLRLGEVARLYALNQETGVSAVRGAGTLVVEKTLDLIFFGLTIVLILPFVVLPDYVNMSGPMLLAVPVVLLVVLYLLAYQTDLVIRLWRRVLRPLPPRPRAWFLRIAVSGLEGLASLRDRRLSLFLLATSLVIALLAVAPPYLLLLALNIPLTLLDAALIHVVVSIAITPPSTPAKIGVFNGAAALMLWQFGLKDEALIFSYAILFYLVVVVPQIALGIVGASRSRWHWRAALPAEPPASP